MPVVRGSIRNRITVVLLSSTCIQHSLTDYTTIRTIDVKTDCTFFIRGARFLLFNVFLKIFTAILFIKRWKMAYPYYKTTN